MTLLGRLTGADGRRLTFARDLSENVRAGDAAADGHRRAIDERIARLGIQAPPHEPDPAELPESGLGAGPRSLDVVRAGIASVVWATGLGPDLGWLPPGGLANRGIYPIGAPWLHRRASGILWGFPGDADRVAGTIAAGEATAPRAAGVTRTSAPTGSR